MRLGPGQIVGGLGEAPVCLGAVENRPAMRRWLAKWAGVFARASAPGSACVSGPACFRRSDNVPAGLRCSPQNLEFDPVYSPAGAGWPHWLPQRSRTYLPVGRTPAQPIPQFRQGRVERRWSQHRALLELRLGGPLVGAISGLGRAADSQSSQQYALISSEPGRSDRQEADQRRQFIVDPFDRRHTVLHESPDSGRAGADRPRACTGRLSLAILRANQRTHRGAATPPSARPQICRSLLAVLQSASRQCRRHRPVGLLERQISRLRATVRGRLPCVPRGFCRRSLRSAAIRRLATPRNRAEHGLRLELEAVFWTRIGYMAIKRSDKPVARLRSGNRKRRNRDRILSSRRHDFQVQKHGGRPGRGVGPDAAHFGSMRCSRETSECKALDRRTVRDRKARLRDGAGKPAATNGWSNSK